MALDHRVPLARQSLVNSLVSGKVERHRPDTPVPRDGLLVEGTQNTTAQEGFGRGHRGNTIAAGGCPHPPPFVGREQKEVRRPREVAPRGRRTFCADLVGPYVGSVPM